MRWIRLHTATQERVSDSRNCCDARLEPTCLELALARGIPSRDPSSISIYLFHRNTGLRAGLHTWNITSRVAFVQLQTMYQEIPINAPHRIQSFHKFIQHHVCNRKDRSDGEVSKYRLGNIANMAQIPLEFGYSTRGTYESTGATTV